jgi:archaellum component FlaF (FlaF/FlaG flagellin family)
MKPEIVLSITSKEPLLHLSELDEALSKGKLLDVEVKVHREKRSLNANAYLWVLIGKIADVLRTSRDEVYISMLESYGQREDEQIAVPESAYEAIVRATNNHCTIISKRYYNDVTYLVVAFLIGSSQYDTRQMAILIDGVVSDCKELGIETLPEAELSIMKEEWGRTD